MSQETRYADGQRVLLSDPKHANTLVEVVSSAPRRINPTGPRPPGDAQLPNRGWQGVRYKVKVVGTGELLEDVEERFLAPQGDDTD